MRLEMNTLLVSENNLHKSFGNTHAVDGVSLQIPAGEIYGLVGADGAGKRRLFGVDVIAVERRVGAEGRKNGPGERRVVFFVP